MEIYFDNAATTALNTEVSEAMLPYFNQHFGNPSSVHRFGRKAREAIETSRRVVATLLNVLPEEIFFTSGATESNNLAISSSIQTFRIRHVITSRLEHHAVLKCLEHHQKNHLIRVSFVDTDQSGRLNLAQLDSLLKNNPATLVSLMHGNNEIGNLNDLAAIGELCRKYKAIFHSDTVQTLGKQFLNLQSINVHFIAGSAHKFHGPKGTGFIYVSKNLHLTPILFGGSQEKGLRAGTENVAGIVGLAKALEIAHYEIEQNTKHILKLKSYFLNQLKNKIEGVRFNGLPESFDESLPQIINVCFPVLTASISLLDWLDISGVAVSGGSACSNLSGKSSHVLKAIQTPSERENIRFSFSKYNTLEEVDFVIEKLVSLYDKENDKSGVSGEKKVNHFF